MISVDYTGRTGNHLFQYTMARLIAEHNHANLMSQFPGNDFIRPTEETKFSDGDRSGRVEFVGDTTAGLPLLDLEGKRAHLHGFFQKVRFYNPHRETIKSFFHLPDIRATRDDVKDDLVVHMRLTDYFGANFKCVISPKWYFNILDHEKWRKLYIVVEPHPTTERYLRYFDQYKPIIMNMRTPEQDFHFIRSFRKIVCSNSTFAWWAAFLSEAETIYTFKEWMGIIRGAVPDLAGIEGAKVISGTFFRDHELELVNWKDYWKR